MKLCEFDSRRFGDDVATLVNKGGRKTAQNAIRITGVSHGTFYRLMNGPPVKNIDTIISIAAYFELSLTKYFKHG